MESHRLGQVALKMACAWLCAVMPLSWNAARVAAQTRLPPVAEERSPATLWLEESIESQRQQSPTDFQEESEAMTPSSRGGMGGIGTGGPMGGSGDGAPFSAYAFFQPESNLQNQSGSLQVRGEGFSLGLPVSKGPNGIWILNTRLEHNTFDTSVALPGGTQPFPDELWNINFGLMHIHPLENGWSAGGMVGIGSASDQPFASIREMNANVLAFLNIPTGERDAWNFSLFYSPLGQLAFPIPGIAYAWRPSERFQMNIGLPFSLNYRPTDALTLNLSYLPLTNGNASLRWAPSEFWTIYGGYQTKSQGYELAERVQTQDRFFTFDQRLIVGVRRTLVAGFVLDGSASYLFDRSYFVSDSFFGSEAERLRVDPGAQLMLRLEWQR
ncbi:DUF6268 family outer membrane beta-barrel protein [Lignipirellula cremea]|uniref:DUF6268 domain-containing protein n=1 Tax=Lignipirellula cremea TaxID=2528010 RepID=A0A518E473_9BACT|nr:DUF6268 family outer membrane beta-barrel protein [Lignipirellula cremea]QDU98863.1 hypothetical protein Pla8534_67740 [Lignipirellula cremea]